MQKQKRHLLYSLSVIKLPPYWGVLVSIVSSERQRSHQSGSYRSKIWSRAASSVRTLHTALSIKTVPWPGWPSSLLKCRVLQPRCWQFLFQNFATAFLSFFEPKLYINLLSARMHCPNIMKTEFNAYAPRPQLEDVKNPPIWRLWMTWWW